MTDANGGLISSFNLSFVESQLLNNTNGSLPNPGSSTSATNMNILNTSDNTANEQHAAMSAKVFADKENKFNSYPMRQKNSNLKMKSSSSVTYNNNNNANKVSNTNLVVLSQEELLINVKLARTRSQESERLKQFLRSNPWPANHHIRKYLWKTLFEVTQATTSTNSNNNKENKNNSKTNNSKNKIDSAFNEAEYDKCLNQLFGKSRNIEVSLPDFVNNNNSVVNSPNGSSTSSEDHINHLNYYYLNENGREAIKRILSVFEYQFPHVTYSPSLVSISSILLHYMQEHEVFSALCAMSSTKEHLIESKSNWETTCSVFIRLLKNYCKSSYDMISKYATEPIETIYGDWYWWIFDHLPFDHLVKIMDCFLYEGQKILYRVGLAIVQMFSKSVKTQNLKVNKDSIRQFCEATISQEPIEKILKISFNIRNLKRSTIREFFLKEESKRKNYHDSSPQEHSKALSKIDENQQINNHSPGRVFLNETSTSILTHSLLLTLWSWLPQRLTVYTPNMLFTTQENGTSINTLYNILDELEYCFLVIKTFQNEIFGAFCSCRWLDRKQNKTIYFGNGETFLFTLMPQKKLFRWIGGIQHQKITSNQEMFIRADSNKIAIGGGGKDGLMISSSLIEGASNTCDTFENEPLSSEANFQIAILEVIGFEIK